MTEVTDPEIIKHLDAMRMQRMKRKEVTDPEIIKNLNAMRNPNPESQGWKGIGQDIAQLFKSAPGEIASGLLQLPIEVLGVGKQALQMPWEAAHLQVPRITKNLYAGLGQLGQGILNSPSYVADYMAKKGIISPQSAQKIPSINKDYDYAKAMGLEGQEAGDQLIRSAPGAVVFGGLGEIGTAGNVVRNLRRAGAGAAYGITSNQNPITSAIASSLIPYATDKALKIPDASKKYMSNKALKYANEAHEKGHGLSPEQANQNVLRNYLNEKGELIPADLGTITNNQVLKDIYNVSSKIPSTGGRAQVIEAANQIQNKSDALAKLHHEHNLQGLSAQEQAVKQQLSQAQEQQNYAKNIEENDVPKLNQLIAKEMAKHENLQGITSQAGANIEMLRNKQNPHENIFKEEVNKGLKQAQKESAKLYEPVNNFTKNITTMQPAPGFKSKYESAYEQVKEHADQLRNLFGDESDIGSKLSAEIKRAGNFFTNIFKRGENNGAQNLTTLEENLKPVYLNDVLAHARTLHNGAAVLKEQGKNIEASSLSRMAFGIKDDVKDILRANGHDEAATALESADAHHISDVLPFYKSKEIRSITNNSSYVPNKNSVADILHDKNFDAIMKRMSQDGRNAAIYELLTGGKYSTKQGASLTPKQIGSNYQKLSSSERDVIAKYAPQLDDYFGNLKSTHGEQVQTEKGLTQLQKQQQALIKQINSANTKAEANISAHESSLEDITKKQKVSQEALQKALATRFGKYEPKNKSIFSAVKNISPLNSAGLGAALFALHGLHPATLIAEALGAARLPAKWANEALTNPELIRAFVQKRAMEHKPMELELTKARRAARIAPYLMPQQEQG
jgi:hypothetical protein